LVYLAVKQRLLLVSLAARAYHACAINAFIVLYYITLVVHTVFVCFQPNCSLYLHLQVDPMVHRIPMPLSDDNAPGIILAQG